MAQRLAKKPISEGFELWDRGYTLGAMRLFIFKAENSPPFQIAPCLDGLAHLLLKMEEGQDAQENFGYAAEKYSLIQQPITAAVMAAKGRQAVGDLDGALQDLNVLLDQVDPERKGAAEAKSLGQLARAYHFKAELHYYKEDYQQALVDVKMALQLGEGNWDRVFQAYHTYGLVAVQLGDQETARQCFEKTINLNKNFLYAYEDLLDTYQALGANNSERLNLISMAIDCHPRANFIKQKAFLMSDMGQDAEAFQMLDSYIANPPHEETEAVLDLGGNAVAVFVKAKAGILADRGDFAQAKGVLIELLQKSPNDDEAKNMLEQINQAEQAPPAEEAQ